MISEILDAFDKAGKKIGKLNLILILLIIFDLIIIITYYRLEFLIEVFENMCYFDYPNNYSCYCGSKSFLKP